ncbi:hypothetical protein ACVWW1_002794 [Bradyrhizobium sp. JR3.5]
MPRTDVLEPPRRDRVGILDGLSLVQHRDVPFTREQHLVIARDQWIGRQNKIVIADRFETLPAVGTMQDENPQAWGELARLVEPVGHQACGSDDDRRIRQMTARLLQRQQRQDLDGLAQSHVVRQHAAQAAFPEQVEPSHALRLVMPQGRIEIGWQDRIRQSAGAEQPCHAAKTICSSKDEVIGFETEQRHDLCARQPELSRGSDEGSAQSKAMERQYEREEAIGRQRQIAAVSQRQVNAIAILRELLDRLGRKSRLRYQRRHERGEIAALAVDFDPERKLEPVDAAALEVGIEHPG